MTWRRHGAALLVTAFLGGQLIGLVHQSTERHAVCPEHGELIHDRAVAGPAAARGSEARGLPESPRHEHDPCELAVASRERVHRPPAAPLCLTPDLPRRQPAPPSAREGSASLALYRTAPKTSPPA